MDHRLPGQRQPDRRAVGPGDTDGRVVDLDDQLGAGRDELGDAGREDRGEVAGRVADQLAPGVGEAIAVRLVGGEEDADVVDDRAVARPGFGRLDPDVPGEVGRDAEALVGQDALRGDGVWLGHLEDDIGQADRPALGELPGWGQVSRVAERHPLVDPGQQRGTLPGGQAPVVGEVAVARVGVPGRHPAILDRLTDRPGPPPRLGEGQERERGDLAGAVARLALLLQDRRDVGGEGDRADRDRTLARRARRIAPRGHGVDGPAPPGAGDGSPGLLAAEGEHHRQRGRSREQRQARCGRHAVTATDRPPCPSTGSSFGHRTRPFRDRSVMSSYSAVSKHRTSRRHA
jgi:hypothetical protein